MFKIRNRVHMVLKYKGKNEQIHQKLGKRDYSLGKYPSMLVMPDPFVAGQPDLIL